MHNVAFAFVLFLSSTHAYSQGLSDAACRAKGSILFPLSMLVPTEIVAGLDLRSYIASPEFGRFDSSHAPEVVFNEIYYTAMDYTHGDLESALFASMLGTIEHEILPLHVIGIHISLPLTTESSSRFALRVSHLPEHLYHTTEGDRDKIQHFFGNAWIKQVAGMDWLAQVAGWLVEKGEGLFVDGSDDDPRDLHADYDGIRFSTEATVNSNSPPSHYLTPNP